MLLPPTAAAVSVAEANLQRYAHSQAGDPTRPESLNKTGRGAGDGGSQLSWISKMIFLKFKRAITGRLKSLCA